MLIYYCLILVLSLSFVSPFRISDLQKSHPEWLKNDELLLQALRSGELRLAANQIDPDTYSVSRISCHAAGDTSSLSTCSFIDYAWEGDPIGEIIIDQVLASLNLTGNCLEAFKAFLCASVFPRCSGSKIYDEVCQATCVQFATACGNFNDIPFGLSAGCWSYPTVDCTDLRHGPALVCEPPAPNLNITTCTQHWGIPQIVGGGSDSAIYFLDLLATSLVKSADLVLEYAGGVSLSRRQICTAAYAEYVCTFYFPRCTPFSFDALTLIPPCSLTCADFLAACPEWETVIGLGTEDGCPIGVPIPTCTGTDVSWSFGYGDPHIATLDHVDYTFNGLGEFWFVHSSQNIGVQVRYEQCSSVNGQAATCTTGVAVSSGVDRAGFYVFEGDNTILAMLNGVSQTTFPFNVGTAVVTQDIKNATLHQITISFSEGLMVQLQWDSSFLWLGVMAPISLHNTIDGLAGKFDGVGWNDFTDRTGSVVANVWDATENDIKTFGLDWQVTITESLFDYFAAPCDSYSNCNVPNFDYLFLSNVTTSLEAYLNCSHVTGYYQKSCEFDVSVTNKTSWRNAAATAEQQAWTLQWSQWGTSTSAGEQLIPWVKSLIYLLVSIFIN